MVFFIHNREYILSIGLVMWKATGQKILESKPENAREQAENTVVFPVKILNFLGDSNFQGSI